MTTAVPVKDSSTLEIMELRDSGIAIKIPKRSAALGHLLLLHITRKSQTDADAEPREISVTGKVIEEEEFDSSAKIVAVQFYQYNEHEWKDFLIQCQNRQREVDAMIRKIQD